MLNIASFLKSIKMEMLVFDSYLEKLDKRLKSKIIHLESSLDSNALTSAQAYSNLLTLLIREYNSSAIQVDQTFGSEGCAKQREHLFSYLNKFESNVINTFRQENNIESMLIYCQSEEIPRDKLKKLDLICEDICLMSHDS